MAKYDVFANPDGDGYLLEVQANLLDELKTRTVVPLVPHTAALKALRRLNPVVTIGGKQYSMFTHLIGTVATSRLTEPRANLAALQEQIDAALDMLFDGF
jgi:toxin CcdB